MNKRNNVETKKLKLPYGIADFAQIRQQGFLYVDRSQYIKTIEDLPENYLVFLHPRRFGKSLFLSLLNYYYGSVYKKARNSCKNTANLKKLPTEWLTKTVR